MSDGVRKVPAVDYDKLAYYYDALGKDGRWNFIDPRSRRSVTLSMQTTYDDETGIVSGEEVLSLADEAVPFLRLPLRFRLIRSDEFTRLAAGAGLAIESVHADFTTAQYREGQCRTAVWTLSPRGTG